MERQKKKRGLVGTIIGIILCIILIPIIIINIILIVNTYIHPENIPGVFGMRPVIVLSGSMEPEFMSGDLIFIQNADKDQLKEGDVICYLEGGTAVTHRIADVTEDNGNIRYTTRGDANNTDDQKQVEQSQVQGIYKGKKIAGAGDFVMFMQSTTGMIIFIVCPIFLLIVGDILYRRKGDKQEQEKRRQLEEELEALRKANQER
ncbi:MULTISPECIES: signal peptidase I [Clostridia]|uniref:signal peptidase I n=1 Tax=Clostridia TaxID=186801 RepID=UPI00067F6B57|nr:MULTISPECIES: signal peptidase I [Clostridia]